MPDINPAELSRPAGSLTTPVLSSKTITVSTPSTIPKPIKTSQIIPARIDIEPIYTVLKTTVGNEQWTIYKDALTQFLVGRLNQREFSDLIDPIVSSPNGDREHMHNQLLAAVFANVTREMPDPGLAPWVSANDKPAVGAGSKPVSGDAAERRLKGEVMHLLSRDRRRIKDLQQNEVDASHSLEDLFADPSHRAKRPRLPAAEPESGPSIGLNMSREQDIRKRYLNPLALESGEFPETGYIESRVLPYCYEAGLESAAPEAAQLVAAATENFIKEFMTLAFSRSRSNGPGESGSAGFGSGSSWVQTHKYKKQLSREEDAAQRGDMTRDKCGLLPIESKAASERGPLSMGDLHLALSISECGTAQFPVIAKGLMNNYRDGELEHLEDYSFVDGFETKPAQNGQSEIPLAIIDTGKDLELPNGQLHDGMDVDTDYYWAGAGDSDMEELDATLESVLAIS